MASVGRKTGLVDGEPAAVTAEEEFAAFYEEWRSPICRSLALALGDVGLANEAVDEALTRALTHWDQMGGYDRPEGWLYRVGLNWARGVFRRRRYELLTDLEPQPQSCGGSASRSGSDRSGRESVIEAAVCGCGSLLLGFVHLGSRRGARDP